MGNRRLALLAMLLLALAPARPAAAAPPRVDVRLVTDEADAVLAILAERRRGAEPAADDWKRLFASEGYVRLARREASLSRAFTDDEFKSFVLSADLLARADALAATLGAWKRTDPSAAARRALAYLPAEARIRAKIYPVIKPRDNSFVFEADTDPSIFLYVDPTERFSWRVWARYFQPKILQTCRLRNLLLKCSFLRPASGPGKILGASFLWPTRRLRRSQVYIAQPCRT